jgi:hypothetical protein
MHLITGFIVASLLGRKKRGNLRRLPSFPGVIETVHLLPGRVRFRTPRLLGRQTEALELKKRLGGLSGVIDVEVNSVSGSICLRFADDQLKPELLLAAIIRLLGLERQIERPPRPWVGREVQQTGEALNRALYERTGGMIDFYTAMPLLLVILGVRNIAAGKMLGWPLLWWAYRELFPPLWKDR